MSSSKQSSDTSLVVYIFIVSLSTLVIPGALCVAVVPVWWYFNEPDFMLWPFLILAPVCLAPAVFSLWWTKKQDHESEAWQVLLIGTLGWLMVCLIGSLPFWWIHQWGNFEIEPMTHFGSYASCLFESISGFTSCGLSMVVKQAAHLPPTLQWWRTLTQWSGGLGVLVWIKYFIDSFGAANSFYDDDQFDTSLLPAISASINGTLTIYAGATGLAIIIFYAAGIDFWEALNHGLTGITGGFTITNDSLYHHTNKYVAIKMPLMLVGALHFGDV